MPEVSWRKIAVGILVGGSLHAMAIPWAGAQEASPTASSSAAASCTVAPRPIDDLLPVWFGPTGTPPATSSEAHPVRSAAELPQGQPADAETVAAINATIQEVFACFDANQYARAFALMTDDAARQFGPDLSDPAEDTPEEVATLLESQLAATPEAGQQSEISEAREVRVLDDGRVGAMFESDGGTAFVLFEQQGDRWLMAEFDFVTPDATPTS